MLRKDILRPYPISQNTVDPEQIKRFDLLACEWWNPEGKFKTVHQFNAARTGYIKSVCDEYVKANKFGSINQLKILDIGCGAGIVSEPLARMGAQVTGIDASEQSILIARQHADRNAVNVDYYCATPETFQSQAQFDLVISLEVVEHVANLSDFLEASASLVRPGGWILFGTLNRTYLSWLLAIITAEYILGWLPKGTHEWDRFVRPSELAVDLGAFGFSEMERRGVVFNPLTWNWALSRRTAVNYLQLFAHGNA